MKMSKVEINKEQALENFVEMIKNSWTYARLTDSETKRLLEMFGDLRTKQALKGTYYHRWEVLQAIYSSYLLALDYKPMGWRGE